jgi:hypothetical protein
MATAVGIPIAVPVTNVTVAVDIVVAVDVYVYTQGLVDLVDWMDVVMLMPQAVSIMPADAPETMPMAVAQPRRLHACCLLLAD